ncbi:MAG: hypothetical protein MUQ65_12065, partial [Armatimonadetes bacterium]|nr:hypothetical protein [Armatimonadota bacterium]
MTREFGLSSDTGANSHHIAYFDRTDEPVRNPGMGLIGYSYSDNMWVEHGTPPRPFEPDAFERMLQLPHCDHLYVRFNWREVQKVPGKLDLPAPLRATLEAVEKHRKPWSFRVMQALPQAAYPYAVPEYLVDKLSWVEDLAPSRFNGGPRFMPVYDEVYLSHWRELLFLLAQQFDGHPLLEFVDISGYGKWGELHHYPRDSFEVPEHGAVIKRLVDDHLAAFANTPAVMQLHPSWTP